MCLGWCLTLGLLGLLFPGALNCRSSGMAGLQGRCRDTRVSRLLPDASGPRSLCLLSGAQHPLLAAPWNKPSPPPPQQASDLQPLLGGWSRTSSLGCVLQFRPVASYKPGAGPSYPCALAAEGDPPHSGTCLPGPTPGSVTPSPAFVLSGGLGGPRTKLRSRLEPWFPKAGSPGPALGQGHLTGTQCPADRRPRQGLQAFPLPPAAPHPALQCMAGC